MHTFLVTGGAGFIGSNLVETLLKDGKSVRVLDNLSTGKEENIREFLGSIEFIKGDIRDKATAEKAVKGVDYVIHLAALGSVPRSIEDPMTTHDVNTTGTLNMLIAAKDAGVKRIVCASSSSVYGNTPVLPKVEDMALTPLSPYAVSKLMVEHYCKVFNRVYGLETVALRYFNVYGKKQDPDSMYAAVIPKFVAALNKNQSPTIFGDGEQSRDFTFVEDCNQANIKACTAPNSAGEAFNVGAGGRISVNQLFNEIRSKMGKDVKPNYAEPRKGDVRDSMASIDKARKLLSYEPVYNVKTGIEKTVNWYLQNLNRVPV